MALQPFSDEQLNFFKFASLVLNEFPGALRQSFVTMWNNLFGHHPCFQLWDDSSAVRNMFANEEARRGKMTKVPVHQSFNEWDCTNLFQATIFAQSFASPGSTTLSDLYVKPHAIPHGIFHTSVVSPGGNDAETFALAIDQLRLLRNSLCHSASSEMDKATFNQRVNYAKDAFEALGVSTVSIDAIGSLTESDFPTKEVCQLKTGIEQVTREYIKFLEEMGSDIVELKALLKTMEDNSANKEDIAMLEEKVTKLQTMLDERDAKTEKTGVRPSLSTTSVPSMVPNFMGRQGECDEIIGHVSSESTQLVSIWGSPGFGKTSVAIAVGHVLQSEGLPVCWVSLRGLKSKAALTSKLLSFFRQSAVKDQPSFSRLALDDQLCQLLSEISERSVFILDNADDLLESGEPKVKEEVTQLIEEILRRNKEMTILVTTRESLEFINVHFQEHKSIRIRALEEASAQTLVHELLPNASSSECLRIAQICGFVPLAIKLMCPLISEDKAQPSQFLTEFMQHSKKSILELLDNSDYPTNDRLQLLFDSSFHKLSAREIEALVSLSILPENFDIKVAAAVLGRNNLQAKKALQSFRRKSLLDTGVKQETFSMHKLLQSFAKEKGETEMRNTFLESKGRLNAFYVSLFEKLNEQFLTGHSMTVFLKFFEEEQSIIQSVLDTLSNAKSANTVFDVLIMAELFLDSLYLLQGSTFYMLYDTAIEAAKRLEANQSYSRLLVSKAFGEALWGAKGSTVQFLTTAKETATLSPSISMTEQEGKRLCYLGINRLATGKTAAGIQHLEEALPLMREGLDQTILRLVTLQILALFYRFKNNTSALNQLLSKAQNECSAAEDMQLLLIPSQERNERKTNKEKENETSNNPLKLQIVNLIKETTMKFTDEETTHFLRNAVHQMLPKIEREEQISTGLLNFHRHVLCVLSLFEDIPTYPQKGITYLQTDLDRFNENSTAYQDGEKTVSKFSGDLGIHGLKKKNYSKTKKAFEQAQYLSVKHFGEEHANTADSYCDLGITHHKLRDFKAALNSQQNALDIHLKLFGEDHTSTAYSYHIIGVVKHDLGDFKAALNSKQQALDIRLKLFGEQHASTIVITALASLNKNFETSKQH